MRIRVSGCRLVADFSCFCEMLPQGKLCSIVRRKVTFFTLLGPSKSHKIQIKEIIASLMIYEYKQKTHE
jgi:hypothetical protein